MEHISDNPQTLREAMVYFADPDTCIEFIKQMRWPDGVVCPCCESKRISFLSTRRMWKCLDCKKQFSAKVGTIFEDSAIGFNKWLPAMWLIASAKNGISSYELHRAIGVCQKTAWFMLHRIRLAMNNGTIEKMGGTVEADETFIGGKAANMHKHKREAKIRGRGASGKEIVIGVMERGEPKVKGKGSTKTNKERKLSKVHVKHVPDTTKETLQGEVKAIVKVGSEMMTDANPSYQGLNPEYVHQCVDHAVAYVVGNVHTNNLENFWTLLKRTLKGTYVSVNAEHLSRYLDEQSFRFNERKGNDAQRFEKVLKSVVGRRLTYGQLTEKSPD